VDTILYGCAVIGALAIVVATVCLLFPRRDATKCQLCDGPRNPSSNAPGTAQYGILACDECAAKLHERYKDDWPPWPPDTPPFL